MLSNRLPLYEVAQVSRRVAAEFAGVIIEAVADSDGEADSVEILLTVRGEHHMLRVRRENQETLANALRQMLELRTFAAGW